MIGFTDIHSHFVYGMDDGAQTEKEMFDMLDTAYQNGIRRLCATPHSVPGLKPFNEDILIDHLQKAVLYCQERGYHLEMLPGAEHLYTPQMDYYAQEHLLRTLGTSNYVLVEFAPTIPYNDLERAIAMLRKNGYLPIIAHAERYRCLSNTHRLQKLKETHAPLIQINADAITQKRPFFFRRKVRKWFLNHLIDIVASDAHNTTNRPFRMREANRKINEKFDFDLVDLPIWSDSNIGNH